MCRRPSLPSGGPHLDRASRVAAEPSRGRSHIIRARRDAAGPNYRELIRLLKAWIREAKRNDSDLRCKSFLLELIVAHLWDQGWNGEPLAVDDYPRAFEQVLGYIVQTGLRTPVVFTDFYEEAAVTPDGNPIQVFDPVNPANNVARTYTESDRQRLVKAATTALEEITWAAVASTKGEANDAWRTVLGPGFEGA